MLQGEGDQEVGGAGGVKVDLVEEIAKAVWQVAGEGEVLGVDCHDGEDVGGGVGESARGKGLLDRRLKVVY